MCLGIEPLPRLPKRFKRFKVSTRLCSPGIFFIYLFIYLCVLSLFMEILPFSLPSSLNVPGAYPGRPSGAGFELIACTGAMGYCSGRGSNQRSPSPRARVIPLPLGYRNFLLLLLFCNFYL